VASTEKTMHLVKRSLRLIAVSAAAAYAAILGAVYFYQRDLQYHPDIVARAPESVGLEDVEAIALETADGETIFAWHRPAPAGRPTILYFHGNAGSISTRPRKLGYYLAADAGLLAVSYRGFGGSSGSPSEAGFAADAEAAYAWLIAHGRSPDDIFLVGESIGSGVAVQLAAKHPVGAVALEAPYANAVDVGAAIYWYLPVGLLMRDQFRSADHIGKIAAPLLVIHGTDDGLIPIEQGRELFARANEPKTFIAVPGGTHDIIGDEATWAAEMAFMERMAAER
jgi:uncharacterized protein